MVVNNVHLIMLCANGIIVLLLFVAERKQCVPTDHMYPESSLYPSVYPVQCTN